MKREMFECSYYAFLFIILKTTFAKLRAVNFIANDAEWIYQRSI